jgi:hypothetical protein
MKNLHGGAVVDMGDVIIAHRLSSIPVTQENYEKLDYNIIPEEPGAFEGLRWLNERFGGNVSVVYKATDFADERILGWFAYHCVTERTGIPLDRVVRTRDGRDKSSHLEQSSATHYGTTVQIDNRLEVLSYSARKVPDLFLFQPQVAEVENYRYTGARALVRVVWTWDEIINVLSR